MEVSVREVRLYFANKYVHTITEAALLLMMTRCYFVSKISKYQTVLLLDRAFLDTEALQACLNVSRLRKAMTWLVLRVLVHFGTF